jgi:pyridoxamine 5'-phosphate oxidase
MELSTEILTTFTALLEQARTAGDPEPTSMVLATATAAGRVSSRVVLLKHVDVAGFVFYTNTRSDKGEQLAALPRAALNFHWKTLRDGVQVRIEGAVSTVSAQQADAYFATRPRESQLGAWASDQSKPLESRDAFMAKFAEVERRFEGAPVPRPPHWSGYRVEADRIEFWYGVPFRLHQRDLYEARDGAWRRSLLNP